MKPLGTLSRGAFFCLFLALGAALEGCQTLETAQRGAQDYADRTGLSKERLRTSVFPLTSYHRLEAPGEALTVYIEGDGIPFRNAHQISPDPTPAHPTMLELASMDPSPNVAYLARPCQYDGSAATAPCEPAYWTDKRFSEEVIASMNEAVDLLRSKVGTGQVHLVGFSGGGAVAVLVAARRQDVASIRTIAGNLDPAAVNRHHRVAPLEGSLDPMSAARRVSTIPQRHFTGTKDRVVPAGIAEDFRRASGGTCVQVTPIEGAGHHEGWVERWKALLKLPVSCSDGGGS
jgi:pimeloyl-ACP methyl ester carboxylesterase